MSCMYTAVCCLGQRNDEQHAGNANTPVISSRQAEKTTHTASISSILSRAYLDYYCLGSEDDANGEATVYLL